MTYGTYQRWDVTQHHLRGRTAHTLKHRVKHDRYKSQILSAFCRITHLKSIDLQSATWKEWICTHPGWCKSQTDCVVWREGRKWKEEKKKKQKVVTSPKLYSFVSFLFLSTDVNVCIWSQKCSLSDDQITPMLRPHVQDNKRVDKSLRFLFN